MPKIFIFLFYVGNVFVDTGECGGRMGTFKGSYRLEKLSKTTHHFAKSIIIGFSIQMNICWRPSFRLQFGSLLKSAGEMTSCKKFLLPEDALHTQGGRYYLPTSPRSSLPPRQRAGRELARRCVSFLKNLKPRIGFVKEPVWSGSYLGLREILFLDT